MRINGFRCDACCKEHLLAAPDLMRQSMREELPTDWFFVSHGKEGKEPLMFCAVECLADWANKQTVAREPKEVVPEEPTRWNNW